MTQCYKGGHEYPVEDAYGAYCEEHGIELVWHAAHDPTEPPHRLLADHSEPTSTAKPAPTP
jgi:hypothetical protein